MVSNGDTTKLIQFLTKQKIGKIEFISEPWSFDDKLADMPQTYKDKFGGSRVTKWVIDLENNQFIKLVNGDVDVKSRMPVGESIGEIQDLIRNDKSNGYSKVVLFRRTSIPGKTAGKFSNESKKSIDNQKLVESAIRKIVRRQIKEASGEEWIEYMNQSITKIYDGLNDIEIAMNIMKKSGNQDDFNKVWKYHRQLSESIDKLSEYMDHVDGIGK